MDGLLPREKLMRYGASALSDVELLAIFLRTGIRGKNVLLLAAELLNLYGPLHHMMQEKHLRPGKIKGIGVAKRTQLLAVIELSQRICKSQLKRQDALLSPDITVTYLQQLLQAEVREVFAVIYLDNQNRMIETVQMFRGSLRSVEVHPREIVRECLQHNAAALILAHNHPSGVPEPSQADRDITQRIIKAVMLIGVRVLDHIVVGKGSFVSFCERGWL
ncbi:DNA repair protein RadC [Enterobacteriaceae bacterium LUAb1]